MLQRLVIDPSANMIQEKNARWIYQAERELEDKEVRYALIGRKKFV